MGEQAIYREDNNFCATTQLSTHYLFYGGPAARLFQALDLSREGD
jgi:hypothetical protein